MQERKVVPLEGSSAVSVSTAIFDGRSVNEYRSS